MSVGMYVKISVSDRDPVVLESKVNAELAQRTNAILAHPTGYVEGDTFIFSAFLNVVSPTAGMGARTMFFKCFGGNEWATVETQENAWLGAENNVNIIWRHGGRVGTYNWTMLLYTRGI